MALTKYKLGELIEESFRKNSSLQYGIEYVRGISNNKEIQETKADVDVSVIHKFYIVNPGEFVYNPRTTRMGDKVGLGYNNTESPLLFSFNNIAFYIKDSAKSILFPEYLYMYFRRPEFDRYAIINSWGSATELFSFEEMCDIQIVVPPLDIQKKYVAIYNSLLANQKSYERGLDDLKLVCDAYIEDLRRNHEVKEISQYIVETRTKNEEELMLPNKSVSNTKVFIDAKDSIVEGVDTRNYLIVEHKDFAYNTVTTRNADKLSLALNIGERCLVSPLYTTFRVSKPDELLPEYLCLWLLREEYDRYARFNSWGSARELFSFETLSKTMIPIPSIETQKAIVDISACVSDRKNINNVLKQQIKDICPILIKGSIEEAQK